MQLIRIDHVQLPVPDTAAAAAWYQQHLGFTPGTQRPDLAIVKLPDGPTLFLWQTGDGSVATFTRDGDPWPTIGIRCEGIHDLRESLAAAGVRIPFFQDEGFGWVMKCFDPYGNMLVLYEEHPKRYVEAT